MTYVAPTGAMVVDKPMVEAYLSREAYSTRTLVNLSHNEGVSIKMTVPEASQLASNLLALVAAAERQA